MSFVVVTELNHVAYVRLNRPEVRNAFNPAMIAELTRIFSDLEHRLDLRAVVLQGEGKSFCAGADLNWMQEMVNFSFDQNRADSLVLYNLFETIAQCTLPVIGFVHGSAFGGALGLIACCDEVVAEEDTQFCFSEVKLGIAPAVISGFVLRKAVAGKVRPLMLSGAIFNAPIAQQASLVTEIAPMGEGPNVLQRILFNYSQCGPQAVRETKKLLNELAGLGSQSNSQLSSQQMRDRCIRLIAERRASVEGQEGLRAFLEKREPSWRES